MTKPSKRKGTTTTKTMWKVAEAYGDKSFVNLILPQDGPEWLTKLGMISVRHTLAGIKLHPDSETDPEFLGALTARAAVAFQCVTGAAPISAKSIQDMNAFIQSIRHTSADLKRRAKPIEADLIQQGAIAESIMSLVILLPPTEQTRFLTAYNRVLVRATEMLDPANVTVEEKIVQMMLFHWQIVARLKSVSELHRQLKDHFAKQGVYISKDRIAKLCQKIGLRFRGRGRPRKSEK